MADLLNVDLQNRHVPFDLVVGVLSIRILLSLQMIYLCSV